MFYSRYEDIYPARTPIYYDDEVDVWEVYRYADVQRVLNDHSVFTNRMLFPRNNSPLDNSMMRQDPPRHRQLRSLAAQAFTPRRVAGLAGEITALASSLIEPAVAAGSIDVIRDLARPLPMMTIAALLGVDPSPDFQRWTEAVLTVDLVPDASVPAIDEMRAFFDSVIASRRVSPADDLISDLVSASVDGQVLTADELYSFCAMLLVAGSETTTNLIGNAVLCHSLVPTPDIPALVEETLRYLTPVQRVPRYTRHDVTIGERVVPAGSRIAAMVGAANRDPLVFTSPDVFLPHRPDNRHLAFGNGPHFCLGASLARLEAQVALETLLRLVPSGWTVAEEVTPAQPEHIICGPASLRLAW